MAHDLKTLEIKIAIPLGASHVDVRRVQQICTEVERLVKAEFPDAAYTEHEFTYPVAVPA